MVTFLNPTDSFPLDPLFFPFTVVYGIPWYCNGMDRTHNGLVAQWFRAHGICLGVLGFDSLRGYSLCDPVTSGVI